MAVNNPSGSTEELIADFKTIVTHFTGSTPVVTLGSGTITFKFNQNYTINMCYEQAKSNCGLSCVYGAKEIASYLASNPLKIGKEENMIILDFVMTIVEKAILVAKKTNIINWSFAYPDNECKIYTEFLERRKKLGVQIQWINTEFKNQNSSNKQVVSNTTVTNDDIPLVTNMTIVNAKTSKRVIDLSKFDAFQPFWHKWSTESLFACEEGLMQFESRNSNKVTFMVVEAINEDHVGKVITQTYTDVSVIVPTLNKVEAAKLVENIFAEREKQAVRIKGERIKARYDAAIANKPVNIRDFATTFVDGTVYSFITGAGNWSQNAYIYNASTNLFYTQNGGSNEPRVFNNRLVALFSANDIK